MRRLWHFLLRPFYRLLLRSFCDDGDHWKRNNHNIPFWRIGSRRPFRWYLEGESIVEVRSFEAMLAWLAECSYAHDSELFNEPDFWQHPKTFEHLRKGDCEDFALWSWRKLLELGYHAEFTIGKIAVTAEEDHGHAWVVFDRDDKRYLLDAATSDGGDVHWELERVKRTYIPEFGVDGSFKKYVYNGHWHLERLRHNVTCRKRKLTSDGAT